MAENNKKKAKDCVLLGCDKKAVGVCNNCNIPICETHSKRIKQFYICVNCYDYIKKLELR